MSKLWGSRFTKSTNKLADKFSYSIAYDFRLAHCDILVSIAHARMLGATRIISQSDAKKIIQGLTRLYSQLEKGTFPFDSNAEDIHTNVQNALKKLIGAAADKLHTARSRNDLIVADMKLYCLNEGMLITDAIARLQKALVCFSEKNIDVIIPAYTHLQPAQVVLLSHHMLAYVEMLERDKGRVMDAIVRMDAMPLGSCALSGTSLPIDRTAVARELGFHAVTRNSMDSVSDRDFLLEMLSALAILGNHFSRMAEDLILWSTREFNLIEIDWAFCTGSSIMPHKKNPDILELIRGESAGLSANLQQLFMLLKGLPLTYNRDLQLDKQSVFSSIEKAKDILGLFVQMIPLITVHAEVCQQRTRDESFFSVDIMEYLITKGVSYRQAHDAVGLIFKKCVDQGKMIEDLTLSELQAFCPKFQLDVKKLLNPGMSVKIKKSSGSTNPKFVQKQIRIWKRTLHVSN